MLITVVAIVCRIASPVPSAPVCHEEIVIQDDMPMQTCIMSQAAVADWKSRSRFVGDGWRIARVRCVAGTYLRKDET